MVGKKIAELGNRYGRWTVLRPARPAPNGAAAWLCRCDCGSESIVRGGSLREGASQSCGCLAREAVTKRMASHGMSRTALYQLWASMKRRVVSATADAYHRYGGRGISIDPRWLDFENFYADMAPRPPRTTLERIDNDGPYCKDNCRWDTYRSQAQNRRDNVLLTLDGETYPVSVWAKRLGMPHATLLSRVNAGWSDERALTEPVEYRTPRKK